MKMIESRCGIICSECEFKSKIGCAGCINIEHPFGVKFVRLNRA